MLYKQFSSIVIAGGASKIIAVIGIIQFLEENKMLKYITNYVGTSAGAVLCTFMAMGYSSEEIKSFFIENLCNDQTITQMDIDELLQIFNSYGMSTGQNLETFFKRMMIHKNIDPGITFIDFAKKFGKNLVICVSNLTDEKCEFWSVDTTPNQSIVTALRVSCGIPFMFTPIIIDGKFYVDGGMYNNFPINYFKKNNLRDILGINIKLKGYQKTSTVFEYIKFIGCSILEKFSEALYKDDKDSNIVALEFEDDNWFSLMDMSIVIPSQKVLEYACVGYQTITKKMNDLYR